MFELILEVTISVTHEVDKYHGLSGQFAVMAELAWRGYNIAIPEIDTGTDILVISEQTGKVTRVEVKTAEAVKGKEAFMSYHPISWKQLKSPDDPKTYYAFAVRRKGERVAFRHSQQGDTSRIDRVKKDWYPS
ncbi:MAG: hypothetical protein R3F46_00155 [bacterium]